MVPSVFYAARDRHHPGVACHVVLMRDAVDGIGHSRARGLMER